MSNDSRYDFILVKLAEGADPAAIEARVAQELGAKPEKIRVVIAHLRDKGAVTIEKAVSQDRINQLKRAWEAAGVVTAKKENLTIVEVAPTQPKKPMLVCPSCGHEQEPKGDDDQCQKCGVFARKFLAQKEKDELYQREKEKMERALGFRKMKEDKEAREAAEQAELDAIRKRIEEELGINKQGGRFAWLTGNAPGSVATRTALILGGVVIIVLGVAGWFGRDAFKGVTPEELAKQQSAQAKQNATQMQNMVGQLVMGSKKMAQASGAAAQFQQALFAAGDKDAELQEQLQAVKAGSADPSAVQVDGDRAGGLAAAARTFADSGGNVEDAERALSASMHSAKLIKDEPLRAEAVSTVAGSQFEVYTQDARAKATAGDWRAADKSFAKALTAAGDLTNKTDVVAARSAVAKVRADTGDYGGATLLFIDAMKAAEELPDPRARAIAIADVARQMAQTTNEIEGSPERGFEKALAVAATVKQDADRASLANQVIVRRVQASCDVARFLSSTEPATKQAKPLLERAAKDADQITDLLVQAKAIGAIARVTAEFEGETDAVKALLERVAKLPETVPEAARELAAAAAARLRAETLAASAKFIASKGDRSKAKQGFIAAMKASNAIATKSPDPAIRSDVARQRTEALSEIARYMQAAGDKQVAAKVFMAALESAGRSQGPKVVSWMVLALRRG